MKQNFNDCLNRVLKDEGGYTNDARDPGGPTNYGITIFDVRKYVKKDATAQDVRNLSLDQAKNIYKSKYWDTLGCDDLDSGVDYTCFDYGVNSGLGRPRACLKRFATKKGADLINAICDERMAFLRNLRTFSTFGKGWSKRVAGVRSYSLQLNHKKPNVVAGPVIATATVAAASVGAGHNHHTLIIVGAVLVAFGLAYLVHKLINR
jgi:lysozyme family protein